MNEYQLTAAAMLLVRLEAMPDRSHSAATLNGLLAPETVARIRRREAEFRDFNSSLRSDAGMLSGDAADYWNECKRMLAYGRLTHARGDRAMERALSVRCEKLDEGFAARVPRSEQGMFLIHELDGSNWDDRWHACMDHCPPILRPEFVSGAVPIDARREAQIEVLTDLVAPPVIGRPPAWAANLLKLARRHR